MATNYRPETLRRNRFQGSGFREFRNKLAILAMGGAVVLIVLGIVAIFVYRGLARSDFFQITTIKIEGCKKTTKNLILELSRVDIHSNLLALNTDRVRADIETCDWVEGAEVRKEWPNRLLITIRERKPVAMAGLPDGLYYIDKKGVAFARVLPPEDMDFPVITGLTADTWPESFKESSLEEALLFIRLAGRGNPVLPKQNISEVHITGNGELILFLADNSFPIYLGKGMVDEKYRRLIKVLYWQYKKKEFASIAYINVEYMDNDVLVGSDGAVRN